MGLGMGLASLPCVGLGAGRRPGMELLWPHAPASINLPWPRMPGHAARRLYLDFKGVSRQWVQQLGGYVSPPPTFRGLRATLHAHQIHHAPLHPCDPLRGACTARCLRRCHTVARATRGPAFVRLFRLGPTCPCLHIGQQRYTHTHTHMQGSAHVLVCVWMWVCWEGRDCQGVCARGQLAMLPVLAFTRWGV